MGRHLSGARAGIRIRVKRSAISQDIQATPRGPYNTEKLDSDKWFSDFRTGQVPGYVTGDPVPHFDGIDVCKGTYHRFVALEIPAECLRIFVYELDGDSFDICGPYSSHIYFTN